MGIVLGMSKAKEAPKHTPIVRRKYVGMQEENLKTPKCIPLLRI
jgi:hypothetical protein